MSKRRILPQPPRRRLGRSPLQPVAAILLVWGLAALTACHDHPQTPAHPAKTAEVAGALVQLSLPAGELAHAPWARERCQPGEKRPGLLACVHGVAITGAQVQVVRKSYPPETAITAIAQALIDEELLAQAAAAKGGWNSVDLNGIQRQTMAAVLLEREMDKVQPATIAAADIQQALKNPVIAARYDHVDSYFTVDAQLLCCTGDFRQCAKREEVTACIDRHAATAQAVYAAVAAEKPQSKLHMWAIVRRLTQQYSDLAPAEVQFYYDKAKPHDQQRGYDVVVEPFAAAVTSMQPGELHPPVRSPFGWHIPYLAQIEPARHQTWKDPAVREEVARNIVAPVREREAERLGFELMRQAGVELFFDRLDPVAAEGAAEL